MPMSLSEPTGGRLLGLVLARLRAVAAAVALLALNGSGPLAAADSPGWSAASGESTTVLLTYQETAYQLLFRDVPVEVTASPVAKEPPAVPGRVLRGVLSFGVNPNNAIPFLWQPGPQRLLLDLHHNHELSNDPAAVFSGRAAFAAPGDYHQVFTNLHLSFPASSTGAPMMVDLEFIYTARSQRVVVVAALRSFWQGKVNWGGQEWQVGLVPNLAAQPGSFRQGQVLVRPWAERERPFFGRCEPSDTRLMGGYLQDLVLRAPDTFAVGPRVFFAGQSCRVDWAAEPHSGGEKFALQLTRQPAILGELRIAGSFIRRLVLEGGAEVVVLSQPKATESVPVGRFYPRCVQVQQGRAEAYFAFDVPASSKAQVMDAVTGARLPVLSPPPADQTTVVEARSPGLMAVGGPLTNSVTATHRGRQLFLSHRLTGAGGGEYRPMGPGLDWQPHFTILRGNAQVGGGKFEFG